MPPVPETRPALSAILITPGGYDPIRITVDHLRAQSVRNRIELVIVTPRESDLGLNARELEGFWGWQIVETGPFATLGVAEAAGIRSARGEIVVYVEEHSFPQAGWAEALIRAHAGRWVAVGPGLSNANPDTSTSWVAFLLDFGRWADRGEAGPETALASHQTSYKREPLLRYGAGLDRWIETETTLHQDLRESGEALYFEPAAVTRHVNVSRLSELVRAEFHSHRSYAARRAEQDGWSWGRRLLYMAGSPLIPLVVGRRQWHVLRRVRLSGRRKLLLGPTYAVVLTAAAVGELFGYALGGGDSAARRLSFELSRRSHVTEADRREIFESAGAERT